MKKITEFGFALLLGLFAPLIAAAAVETAAVETELVNKAKQELYRNILPFWLAHAPDRKNGGFNGQVNLDLSIAKEAPRGSLLASRILWTFSAACRLEKKAAFLAMARRACDELQNRFWDQQNGGLFWTIAPDGKPLDTTKHVYGQAFGVYALSEFYRVTEEPAALERAIALYRLVEQHAHDKKYGGYFEVFARDWKRARQCESLVSPFAAKSQNTHLHIMEAYTNLFRVWPDAGLRQNLHDLVELMLTRIYDEKTHHLRLLMDEDWTLKSDHYSYGHDIEAAWLMNEAAEVLGDSELLARTRRASVEIAETTLKEGIDVDGGVFNEGNERGVVDASKDWWPQAEAVVGFLDAYRISGDKRFLDAAVRVWTFIDTRIVDHVGGEWFYSVGRDGTPSRVPKISLWKCPYHNSRACLEVTDRLSAAAFEKKP